MGQAGWLVDLNFESQMAIESLSDDRFLLLCLAFCSIVTYCCCHWLNHFLGDYSGSQYWKDGGLVTWDTYDCNKFLKFVMVFSLIWLQGGFETNIFVMSKVSIQKLLFQLDSYWFIFWWVGVRIQVWIWPSSVIFCVFSTSFWSHNKRGEYIDQFLEPTSNNFDCPRYLKLIFNSILFQLTSTIMTRTLLSLSKNFNKKIYKLKYM